MPVLSARSLPDGDIVEGSVALPSVQLSHLRQSGRPVPPAVDVRILIDTGADQTAIDSAVIAALGLQPTIWVTTAVAALGSLSVSPQYDVGLTIVHPSANPKLNLHLRDFTVIEMPLAHLGHQVVIGRDVLKRCLYVHDGPAGTFSLAY